MHTDVLEVPPVHLSQSSWQQLKKMTSPTGHNAGLLVRYPITQNAHSRLVFAHPNGMREVYLIPAANKAKEERDLSSRLEFYPDGNIRSATMGHGHAQKSLSLQQIEASADYLNEMIQGLQANQQEIFQLSRREGKQLIKALKARPDSEWYGRIQIFTQDKKGFTSTRRA
jgi:hypothetical protein